MIKCKTSKNDSVDFDFEAKPEDIKLANFRAIKDSNLISRQGTLLLNKIKKKMQLYDKVLFKVKRNINKKFYINCNLQLTENKINAENNNRINWEDMCWFVVKELKQRNINLNVNSNKNTFSTGYILNIGDVLKFGNIKLKVNDIKLEGYQEIESSFLKKANSIDEGKILISFYLI